MTPDCELLRRFSETNSEDAFAELVRRHLDLVYSAALRQVNGDAHLAQDVAQTVFTDLARKAASLSRRSVLTGWLYTSTHFAAAKAVRTEGRRRAREQEAHTMRELLHDPASDVDWDKLHSVLDEAMHKLKDSDREAILLRYFEKRPLAEIGAKLGVNENTARMRVERALEKLRIHLVRRGVTTTAAALSAAITVNAIQVAPAGLAVTLATASLATAAAGTGTTLTFLKFMAITKVQTSIIGAAAIAGAAYLAVQHQTQIKLRGENQSLRQQMAQLQTDNEGLANRFAELNIMPSPRLPAPHVATPATSDVLLTDDLQSTNLYARLGEKTPSLTAAQLEAYLKTNGRSAASLLAAFRTSQNQLLLEEAMQKFPNDPQVDFEAACRNLSPEEHRRWLDAFKRSAPENALANYFSALDYFKSGQTDQAVQEFMAASGKPFQDYRLDRLQADEEAYREAGYSVAEAKAFSSSQLMLPQLGQMKAAALQMVDLANSYRQAGDENSAQAALQMAASVGQRYGNGMAGESLSDQFVGIAIQRNALSAMNPTTPYGGNGQTVQDRLNELLQQRTMLKELDQQFQSVQAKLSTQDWISYVDRCRTFGHVAGMQWAISKYNQQ